MITELTKEQEKMLLVYRDKGIETGLSTKRIDRKKAIDNFYLFNKEILNNQERIPVLFFDSPLSAWIAVLLCYNIVNQVENQVWDQVSNQVRNQVSNQVENQVRNQVWNQLANQVRNQVENQVANQVWDQVWDQVSNQVRNQVSNQVRNQVRNQVWNQVENQVSNQVRNQVSNQVWNQVSNQVWNQVWNQVRDQVANQVSNYFVYPYLCGNFDSSYFYFCSFIYDILLSMPVGLRNKWDLYKRTSEVSLIYPFKDFCIISEKPTKISMKQGVLHNETSASVEYADGLSVYSLNGVKVTKKIVETPWDKLDSNLIINERNVEVRREIVRKIGIEKICKDLNAKKIDCVGDYELLILDIGNRRRPYLKMKNPSIGCYHIEGVPPECDTIEKALNSRKPLEMRKIKIDDIKGEDWYQQGDVCIWPENAKLLKAKPKILT